MTYLTEAEIEAIQHLPRDTPYCIHGVTQTQFSVARHFGTCKFNGYLYTYFPATDELIRDDVLKEVTKLRKQARRDELAAEQAKERELDL